MKEIKTMYGKLKDKKAFCLDLSREVDTGAMTIYNHWFGSFWAIPEKYQEIVLTKLKEKDN